MDKDTFINNLSKVKIIIGNGFDLHCRLRTSYSDYFRFNHKKTEQILDWLNSYRYDEKFDLSDDIVNEVSIWSIFFVINNQDTKIQNKYWCDIERMIYYSLMTKPEGPNSGAQLGLYLCSRIHWEEIKKYVLKDNTPTSYDEKFLVWFMKKKMKLLKYTPNNYYDFILSELNIFERNFGEFVYNQTHKGWIDPYLKDSPNNTYIGLVNRTIKDLCNNLNEIVSIDSFNYSEFDNTFYCDKTFHINGNWKNPIFGIDTVFKPSDERFVFTKTYRRITLDFMNNTHKYRPYFQNVIVYGHSLNSADYSYFFPIFDQIKLMDSLSEGVLIFAYSIFDESKKNIIENELRKNISNLIFAYANNKKMNNPERLLDYLGIQNRIIIKSIPNIEQTPGNRTFIDDIFEKLP